MKRVLFVFALLIFVGSALQAQGTRLLRMPDIHHDQVTFVYANDIWVSSTAGDNLKRLTSFQGAEFHPHFSPEGNMIAFTGEYDGNLDVYVVPTSGGEPQRLTFHPGRDAVKGWTPDGQSVIFASGRHGAPYPMDKFYTISLNGSFPSAMPLHRVFEGQLSDDSKQMVYQKLEGWETEFRNYRGGQNNPIRIANMSSLEVKELPWDDSQDTYPVWANGDVYFLSDRDFANNIWHYDPDTDKVSQVTSFGKYDCKRLESDGNQLIFENGGYLYTLDASSSDAKPKQLEIEINADFSWARPKWIDVHETIRDAALSASGKRALFSSRGDIFSVPAKKGSIRNLTNTPGVADREPACSPDGKWVSWFSDASGDYMLHVADAHGENKKEIKLDRPTYFYTAQWSPDSKFLSMGDTDRALWIINIETGENIEVDDEGFAHPIRNIYPEWSPDSKWLSYSKRLENEYNAIFIFSLDERKSYQLTDGMSDCMSPAWDKNGEYLYFLSSIDYGLNVGWLDMSSLERPLNYGIYCTVLNKKSDSPLAPESDEEEVEEDEAGEETEDTGEADEKEEEIKVSIDWDGIAQRTISMQLPVRRYTSLEAGENKFFYTEIVPPENNTVLHRYDHDSREVKEWSKAVSSFSMSPDKNSLLINNRGSYTVVSANEPPGDGASPLSLSGMMMKLDPQAEWKQIFNEALRYQRDYFYVENVHGLDLEWAKAAYEPWLEDVRHRSDLTYILDILGGETAVGHSFTGGGETPDVDRVPVGLLGADFSIENGKYKIEKIYNGESWNHNIKAPLSGPGIDVSEGDFILAVNGRELTSDDNIFDFFDHTSGKQIAITLSKSGNSTDQREQIVVPVESEFMLRQHEWVETNRRMVDELSDGQLAYVWLPNTGQGGYNNFNRYFFAQKHKKGAVIDERFNQGGYAADYIVDLLSRDLMGYFNNPVGDKQPFTSPGAGVWGPKVMLINEMAGSGGDYLPYMFKKKNIGPLVGKKTWGGLVGIWDVPPLNDGGFMTAPRGGFFNTDGEWDVENIGVAPDIEVEDDPASIAKGVDPQLRKAIDTCLELIKQNPVELKKQPADPVRARRPRS